MTQRTHLPRRPAGRRWVGRRRPLDGRVRDELAIIASRRAADDGLVDLT